MSLACRVKVSTLFSINMNVLSFVYDIRKLIFSTRFDKFVCKIEVNDLLFVYDQSLPPY